jgi:spore germination cell wall hydrolase CwlJ-like protein
MRTAPQAVKYDFTLPLRLIFIAIGLMLIISCVKHAMDYRVKAFQTNPEVIATSALEIKKQLQCLSRNIYWEAASEPFEGKVAVAQVTMNRMQSGKFPDTVCGVVYQKTSFYNKVVCQFSWFCETNHYTKPVYPKYYQESEEVARMVMLEGFRLSNLKNALYYHADYVNPKWNKEKVTQIGRHIFYKDKNEN